jgi:hypothetical protein
VLSRKRRDQHAAEITASGKPTRRSLAGLAVPFGQNEGLRDRSSRPTLSMRFRAMRQRKAASMSAEELKRKLRNFPIAKLSERLAA